MKRATVYSVIVAAVLAGSCTTTPTERRENVSQSLVDVKNGMVLTRTQINKALNSLNALMNARSGDIREAYNQYASDVESLQKNSDQVLENDEELREQRDNWLEAWQESQGDVENEELKQISSERRSQIASRFDNVSESFSAAQDAFLPLLENLDDVKTVVGNDLTPTGIDAVADTEVVQEARRNGAEVQENLEAAIAEFDELTEVLGPPTD